MFSDFGLSGCVIWRASRSRLDLQAPFPHRSVPCPRRQVVEPNQIDVVAPAVPRDPEQIVDAVESRFAGQIIGDVRDSNRRDRIDDDVPLVHAITAAHFYVRTRPDADAAPDPPAPDSLTKAFSEQHKSGWLRWRAFMAFARRRRCGRRAGFRAAPAGTSTSSRERTTGDTRS